MKTNVAETSIESIRQHRESGKSMKQKERIVHFLKHQATGRPYTRRQIAALIGMELSAVCGRVNSLVNSGALQESTGKCPITKRAAKLVYWEPENFQTELDVSND